MLPKNYFSLPKDLAGSIAKNRFRLELLWGIKRILDMYDETTDFVAIFDYVCDVEIHFSQESIYYQIKTKNDGSPFTLQRICTMPKGKRGNQLPSIMGKLMLIKSRADESSVTKVAIVANTVFTGKNGKTTGIDECSFDQMDSETITTIKSLLKKELGENIDVDLSSVYYIRTHMDIVNPDEALIGSLVKWFPKHFGRDVVQANALYNCIKDAVEEKACYEFIATSEENLIERKGITKKQFDAIIEEHNKYSSTGIERAKAWVNNNIHSYNQRISLMQSLAEVLTNLVKDKRLAAKMDEISVFIDTGEYNADLEVAELLALIKGTKCIDFPSTYSKNAPDALILLILMKKEEELCVI